MKKLLALSVIAVLVASPMMACADEPVVSAEPAEPVAVAGDPGATVVDAPMAAHSPRYGLKNANPDVDGKLATAGYVKGAYNAAIKAVNKLDDIKQDKLNADDLAAIANVSTLSGRVSAAESDIDGLETVVGDNSSGLVKKVADLETASETHATQDGVVATIKNATVSATNVSLGVTGTPTGTVSSNLSNGAFSGSVNIPTSATVAIVTTWDDDTSTTTAPVALNTTSTQISGGVTGDITSTFTGTGISGTATGTVNSTINVTEYDDGQEEQPK